MEWRDFSEGLLGRKCWRRGIRAEDSARVWTRVGVGDVPWVWATG